jgi:ubiquinone/menaquinone biosynthesis C-methylase UbiE/Co/Zn/Cd efflux system component
VEEREWHPPWLVEQFFRLAPWGFPRQVLVILADGDKTLPEILEGFARFMHHFGHFGREQVVAGFTPETFPAAVEEAIEELEREGAVIRHGEVYGLTSEGQQRAKKHQREYREFGQWIQSLLHPQTVSLVSLGVHILLAVLKLIAGAISGSIGLISDGMDTAMDGLSSVLVFVGLRLKVEKIVNVVLVLLMLGVGIGAGYEAVHRVFVPEAVDADVLTFAAAILSGLVCLLLSLYQRYVATRSKQLPLISQAVDSRNHAVVAAGVTVGLVATLLGFPFVDTFVGLAVAALILRSGVELAVETVRALRGEEVDLTQYELGFVEAYGDFQERQLADWLLSVVAEEGPLTRPALLARCREMLDAREVPILREMGWGKEAARLEKRVTKTVETLIVQSLLVADGEVLQVTEKGRAELSEEVWGVEELAFYARAMEPRIRWVQAPSARRIVESLPSLPGNPLVVDVGTGPGFLCIELAKLLPDATLIGVDPSPQAVETARQYGARAGLERFEARQGRAEQIPVDSGAVDLVVSQTSLHEWRDAQAGFSEIHRVLQSPEPAEGKPGGVVVLEDLNGACPRWKRTLFVLLTNVGFSREIARVRLRAYETTFTLEEVEGMLERSGFEVIQSEAGLNLFALAVKRER